MKKIENSIGHTTLYLSVWTSSNACTSKTVCLRKIRSKQKVFVNCCFIRWNKENGEKQIFENGGKGDPTPQKLYIKIEYTPV